MGSSENAVQVEKADVKALVHLALVLHEPATARELHRVIVEGGNRHVTFESVTQELNNMQTERGIAVAERKAGETRYRLVSRG